MKLLNVPSGLPHVRQHSHLAEALQIEVQTSDTRCTQQFATNCNSVGYYCTYTFTALLPLQYTSTTYLKSINAAFLKTLGRIQL